MVRDNPAMGKMTVKVQSTWERGTKAVVTVGAVHALGQNIFPRTRRFVITSDDPAPLGGVDSAPFPPELPARRARRLRDERDRDQCRALRRSARRDGHRHGGRHRRPRVLGHDKSVRNGITDIRYTVTIQSPAPEEKVRRCKETIDRKSPIRDTLANPVNITSELVYKQS